VLCKPSYTLEKYLKLSAKTVLSAGMTYFSYIKLCKIRERYGSILHRHSNPLIFSKSLVRLQNGGQIWILHSISRSTAHIFVFHECIWYFVDSGEIDSADGRHFSKNVFKRNSLWR